MVEGPEPGAAGLDEVQLVSGAALHRTVIEQQVLKARSHVWIATADLKDMHVRDGRRYRPVLALFDAMAARGVSFRVVHSSLPSRYFRKTLERYQRLTGGALELQVCPRSHWKMVIVDGSFGYCGSANFTGAGLGAKSPDKRNLELGIVSSAEAWVRGLEAQFDRFWIGEHCGSCRLRQVCPDPVR